MSLEKPAWIEDSSKRMEVFKRATDGRPNDPVVWNMLGQRLYERQQSSANVQELVAWTEKGNNDCCRLFNTTTNR